MRSRRTGLSFLRWAWRVTGAVYGVGLIGVPVWAMAQVSDTVTYRHYPVQVLQGESLARAISSASPIRPRWWQRFHGLAAWNVSWTYRQQVRTDGACEATDVAVEVVTEITLPQLVQAPEPERQRFADYLQALQVHELGHHDIARGAAQWVRAGIEGLPPQPDCEALDAQVQSLTARLIDEAKGLDKRYDSETQYGRTQGAYLEP